jgi:CheY-specific phosphatase CheX
MDQNKFDFFCNCFEESLKKIITGIPGMALLSGEEWKEAEGKKLSSIVGVVGLNKGRVHVEMNEVLAQKLYEGANGEPAGDEMDLCFYLAEFTNMITGSGITMLNNTYKGSSLRLTPPAIFAGENLDITTPKVQSAVRTYKTKYGPVLIEIGFEGV